MIDPEKLDYIGTLCFLEGHGCKILIRRSWSQPPAYTIHRFSPGRDAEHWSELGYLEATCVLETLLHGNA